MKLGFPGNVFALAVTIFFGLLTNLAGAKEPGADARINDRFVANELDVAEWTEKFEGESREIYVHRQAIVDALGLFDKARVADVGAGTGFFSELLAERVGSNGQVWALEISPVFAQHMKARFEKAGLNQIEVIENSRRSTGLAESALDLAFLCDVYHHFEYPAEMLRNLRYVLRPRGELVVVDFERIPGKTPDWILEHVRAGKDVFREEIEQAGFVLIEEVEIDGLEDNYVLRFRRR